MDNDGFVLSKCPVLQSDNERVVYAYVCDAVDDIPVADRISENVTKTGAFYNSACIGTIYRVLLREPYVKDKHLTRADILSYKAIANSKTVESERRPLKEEKAYLDKEANKQLQIYMRRPGINLPPVTITQLYKRSDLRPLYPMTVYRGLNFTSNDLVQFFDALRRTTLRVGDTFPYSPSKTADSWTTNVCLAVHFATLEDYGLVVKYTSPAEEVILDTRRIENLDDFYHHDQAEIILSNYPISFLQKAAATLIDRTVEVVFISLNASDGGTTLRKPLA